MELQELIFFYQKERQQKVVSMNRLLDFCQLLYIRGDIDVSSYRKLLEDLYEEGATFSHELVSTN